MVLSNIAVITKCTGNIKYTFFRNQKLVKTFFNCVKYYSAFKKYIQKRKK